jgi:hypothetical protein
MKLNGQTRVIVATAAVLALVDIGVRVAALRSGVASVNGGVVTAREFRLTDSYGNVRATMSVDDSGEPGLRMFDRNGALRLQLDTFQNNPSLILCDKEGQRKTFFGTNENTGNGILTEYGPDGMSTRTSIELDGSTGSVLSIRGGDGEPANYSISADRMNFSVR